MDPAREIYNSIGGVAACQAISQAFHDRIDRDPLLRPLFPAKNLRCAIHQFTAFLTEFLGGANTPGEGRVWISLHQSHLRFRIGLAERQAWLDNMKLALADAEIPEPARTELTNFFAESSAYLINDEEPPQVPPCNALQSRWTEQRQIDAAARAIQNHDASSLTPDLVAHGKTRRGRSLLHEAAAAGCLTAVQTLLKMGMDVDKLDGGRHTPLYSVSNECKSPTAVPVVQALLAAGADINANAGAKRCTALHMAARRGNAAVAKVLLDSGADPNLPDSAGVTPLRRALNCRQPAVGELLRSRGARA